MKVTVWQKRLTPSQFYDKKAKVDSRYMTSSELETALRNFHYHTLRAVLVGIPLAILFPAYYKKFRWMLEVGQELYQSECPQQYLATYEFPILAKDTTKEDVAMIFMQIMEKHGGNVNIEMRD